MIKNAFMIQSNSLDDLLTKYKDFYRIKWVRNMIEKYSSKT